MPLREYDLDDILAEFGTGAVSHSSRGRAAAARPEPVSQPQQPGAGRSGCGACPRSLSLERRNPPRRKLRRSSRKDTDPGEGFPGDRGKSCAREHLVSLEDMMDRTVSAVMEEESAQRQLEREEQERQARRAPGRLFAGRD